MTKHLLVDLENALRQLEQHPQGLTGLAGYRMTDANLAYAGATFGGG